MHRRNFIKATGFTAASAALLSGETLFAQKPGEAKVKMGIIGVGARGLNHLDLLLRRDDVELVAICDIDDKTLEKAKGMITKSGKKCHPFLPVMPVSGRKCWN